MCQILPELLKLRPPLPHFSPVETSKPNLHLLENTLRLKNLSYNKCLSLPTPKQISYGAHTDLIPSIMFL